MKAYNIVKKMRHLLFMYLLIIPQWRCAYVDVDVQLKEFSKVIRDFKTETVSVLDYGITSLNKNSADWETILDNVKNQLVNDIQSTIKVEVQNLLDQSIAMLGKELQCQMDIIGIKVKNKLERMKARLLDLPEISAVPYVCSTVPADIDMLLPASRRNSLKIFGYFDSTNYKLILIKKSLVERDITHSIAKKSSYELDVNLGSNGIELGADDHRIELRSLDNKSGPTINVIQPVAPKCFVGEVKVIPRNVANPYTFSPKRYCNSPCRPDLEFGSTPVEVFCDVKLEAVGNAIYATIRMNCYERGGDNSFVIDSKRELIHRIESDRTITGFVTGTYSYHTYTNKLDQVETHGPTGPVNEFKFNIRNSKSEDINSWTRVDIRWNEIIIKVKQVGNCK